MEGGRATFEGVGWALSRPAVQAQWRAGRTEGAGVLRAVSRNAGPWTSPETIPCTSLSGCCTPAQPALAGQVCVRKTKRESDLQLKSWWLGVRKGYSNKNQFCSFRGKCQVQKNLITYTERLGIHRYYKSISSVNKVCIKTTVPGSPLLKTWHWGTPRLQVNLESQVKKHVCSIPAKTSTAWDGQVSAFGIVH